MAAAPPHSKVPSSHHAACAEVPDVGGTVPFRCVSLPPLECKPRVQLLFLRHGQGHELIRPLPSAPPLLESPSPLQPVSGFGVEFRSLSIVVLGALQKLDPTKPWYVNLTAISRAGLGNLV